jgi:hypothetical protein
MPEAVRQSTLSYGKGHVEVHEGYSGPTVENVSYTIFQMDMAYLTAMHPPRLDYLEPSPRIGHRHLQNLPRSVYFLRYQNFELVIKASHGVTLGQHHSR